MQLHNNGNEAAWWVDLKVAPMKIAEDLWAATLRRNSPLAATQLLGAADDY